MCRKHLGEQKKRTAKPMTPQERTIRGIWSRAHRDVHDFYGRDTSTIRLTHLDIRRALTEVSLNLLFESAIVVCRRS